MRSLFLCFVILLSLSAYSQQNPSGYKIFEGIGIGKTEKEARREAEKDAKNQITEYLGSSIKTRTQSYVIHIQNFKDKSSYKHPDSNELAEEVYQSVFKQESPGYFVKKIEWKVIENKKGQDGLYKCRIEGRIPQGVLDDITEKLDRDFRNLDRIYDRFISGGELLEAKNEINKLHYLSEWANKQLNDIVAEGDITIKTKVRNNYLNVSILFNNIQSDLKGVIYQKYRGNWEEKAEFNGETGVSLANLHYRNKDGKVYPLKIKVFYNGKQLGEKSLNTIYRTFPRQVYLSVELDITSLPDGWEKGEFIQKCEKNLKDYLSEKLRKRGYSISYSNKNRKRHFKVKLAGIKVKKESLQGEDYWGAYCNLTVYQNVFNTTNKELEEEKKVKVPAFSADEAIDRLMKSIKTILKKDVFTKNKNRKTH